MSIFYTTPTITESALARIHADLLTLLDGKRADTNTHPGWKMYPKPIDSETFAAQRQRAREMWKGQGR